MTKDENEQTSKAFDWILVMLTSMIARQISKAPIPTRNVPFIIGNNGWGNVITPSFWNKPKSFKPPVTSKLIVAKRKNSFPSIEFATILCIRMSNKGRSAECPEFAHLRNRECLRSLLYPLKHSKCVVQTA